MCFIWCDVVFMIKEIFVILDIVDCRCRKIGGVLK